MLISRQHTHSLSNDDQFSIKHFHLENQVLSAYITLRNSVQFSNAPVKRASMHLQFHIRSKTIENIAFNFNSQVILSSKLMFVYSFVCLFASHLIFAHSLPILLSLRLNVSVCRALRTLYEIQVICE